MAPEPNSAVQSGIAAESSFQPRSAEKSRRKPTENRRTAAASSQRSHWFRSPAGASSQQTGKTKSVNRAAPSTDAIPKPAQIHWEYMEALRQRMTVHLSRSLDHYCHKRVSAPELRDRVLNQVLTRFMERQGRTDRGTTPARKEHDYLQTFLSFCSITFNGLRQLTSKSRSSHQSVSSVEQGLGGGKAMEEAIGSSTKLENAAPVTKNTQSPLQILTAPQFWLWKFDSKYKFSRCKKEPRTGLF